MNVSSLENIKFLSKKNIFEILNSLTSPEICILSKNINLEMYKASITSSMQKRKFISKLKKYKNQYNFNLVDTDLKNKLIQVILCKMLNAIDKHTFLFKQNFLETNETLNTTKFNAKDINFSIYVNQVILDELSFLLNENISVFLPCFQEYTFANLQKIIVNFIQYKIIKMQNFDTYLFNNFDFYFNLKHNRKYILNSRYKSKLINKHKIQRPESINVVYQNIKSEPLYATQSVYRIP